MGQSVLVVDDDELFCQIASAGLRKAGLDAYVAHDGCAALELMRPGAFLAAMIDLDMPRIDGARLISLLRGDQRLNAMAIVVVSGSHDMRLYEALLASGADAFEVKPVDWRWFPTRLRHHISRRQELAKLLEVQRQALAPAGFVREIGAPRIHG